MPSLTIKDIPVDLYKRLKRSAEAHRRSLNSEVIVCLERVLGSHRPDRRDVLADLERLHARIKRVFTAEEIAAAIRSGRR